MRKYALDKLYLLVQDQARAVTTIGDAHKALTSIRNLIAHLKEHGRPLDEINALYEATQKQMLALESAQSAADAKAKADAKRARLNDPRHVLRRLFTANTSPALKNNPALLKDCYIVKSNRRLDLFTQGKNMLLAKGLTLREIMTLKAMAASNYAPINWEMDV